MDTTREIVLPLLFVMWGRPDCGAVFMALGLVDLFCHVVEALCRV